MTDYSKTLSAVDGFGVMNTGKTIETTLTILTEKQPLLLTLRWVHTTSLLNAYLELGQIFVLPYFFPGAQENGQPSVFFDRRNDLITFQAKVTPKLQEQGQGSFGFSVLAQGQTKCHKIV